MLSAFRYLMVTLLCVFSVHVQANSAMYQAKKQGKNQVCYYSKTLDTQIQRVKQIEQELRKQPFDSEFQLSINLSSANLNSVMFADDIIALAQAYQLEPNLLEFEITETFDAGYDHDLLLAKLSEYGFNLAIDDFGSGYTSITQLVQYPVQKIKFDRLFLNTLLAENKPQIIKPLIDLCHSQSMLVTAEGIETEAMSKWLTDYQCDLLQGYHYGQPMAADKIPAWLANYQHDTVATG